MNKDMQIIREVSAMAESEAFYDKAESLGKHAAHALKAQHRSQLTGLENIAESTLKTTDILDYIKKQTARYPFWQQGYPQGDNPNEGFGESLKKWLESDLRTRRETICSPKRLNIGDSTDEDKLYRRHVYLLLMRQFIRQMVVEYEYRVNLNAGKRPVNTGSGPGGV
ncbi:MAG: hypothetical protein ACYDER_12765 [Ktedonobacteraceae bacterium]